MKKTVYRDEFIESFKKMGREDNFSHYGLNKLYDYLLELEQETEAELELDVIDICCNYTENTIEDVVDNYNLESIEDLADKTTVIYKDDNNVLYRNF
jgi:hypothetical protein